MKMKIVIVINSIFPLALSLPVGAETQPCDREYVSQSDAELPDLIEVGSDRSLIEFIESTYDCFVPVKTLESMEGVEVALATGLPLGKIDKISVNPENETGYATLELDERYGTEPRAVRVRLDQMFVPDGYGSSRTSLSFQTPYIDVDTVYGLSQGENFETADFADFQVAGWLDPILQTYLPPERVDLEILSEPLEAAVMYRDEEMGVTKTRFIVREAVISEIILEKNGFETCHFSDATYNLNGSSRKATLKCILSATPSKE